jgi:DNA-binding NarL/FixJ family response regulator
VPLEEGRLLATLLPQAHFVPLPTANHFPREDEPAWGQFVAESRAFLPGAPARERPFQGLTARERELLELLARGLDNHQIAAHLGLSEKTVRNMVSSILAKLEVESRARAIVLAREAGYGTEVPR